MIVQPPLDGLCMGLLKQTTTKFTTVWGDSSVLLLC